MAEESLEERLRLLEEKLGEQEHAGRQIKRTRRLGKRTFFSIVFFATLIIVAAVFLAINQKKAVSPLEGIAKKNISFTLYYPSDPPAGYKYDDAFTTMANGILSYRLKNNTKQILVTEQVSPGDNLNIDSIVGFSPLKTGNGIAYVGTNQSAPVAILNTKSTLVNVTGSADVSADVVNSLVESLKELH